MKLGKHLEIESGGVKESVQVQYGAFATVHYRIDSSIESAVDYCTWFFSGSRSHQHFGC